MLIDEEDNFEYPPLSRNPPPITGFWEEERIIKDLITQLKRKLPDEQDRRILLRLLKLWGPFYENSKR